MPKQPERIKIKDNSARTNVNIIVIVSCQPMNIIVIVSCQPMNIIVIVSCQPMNIIVIVPANLKESLMAIEQ
jgi:hypothetical protein